MSRQLGFTVALCALAVALWRFTRDSTGPNPPEPNATSVTPRVPQHAAFELLADRLRAGGLDQASVDAQLGAMTVRLAALPRPEAATLLQAWLDSGRDAPTGLIFKIGDGGELAGAPTLRVWLLDQLGRCDVQAAADYAPRIYARSKSADEWAVALRDDWRAGVGAGRAEAVRGRALDLMANPEWTAAASIGFLEACDVAVAALAWEAVPRWEAWMAPAQAPALRHAAWVALDRLTLEAPEDFLPILAGRPEWLASQPNLRAGLMARMDPGSERQRAAVELYLANSALTES